MPAAPMTPACAGATPLVMYQTATRATAKEAITDFPIRTVIACLPWLRAGLRLSVIFAAGAGHDVHLDAIN